MKHFHERNVPKNEIAEAILHEWKQQSGLPGAHCDTGDFRDETPHVKVRFVTNTAVARKQDNGHEAMLLLTRRNRLVNIYSSHTTLPLLSLVCPFMLARV